MISDHLVSIIIPCYMQGIYLNETLKSVANQTYKNWECIIINDGSPDNTDVIGREWVARDNRFRYVNQVNGGLSNARNSGLKLAKGTYIQFLDSDDLLENNKLEVQVQELNKNRDISISNYFPFKSENNKFEKDRYLPPYLNDKDTTLGMIRDWEHRISFPPHCVLFRASILKKNNLSFEEDLENHEDWVFWVKLFYFSEEIVFNNLELVRYRIHSSSMTADYFKMKDGFLKATKTLQHFFLVHNETSYKKEVLKKRKEILNKGREPLYVKLPKKLYRKFRSYFKDVRKN